jgi:hypothetical protein
MKGLIVSCEIADSAIDAIHGASHRINRLVVPQWNNLTITPHHGTVHVWDGRGIVGEVVAEVDVPTALARAARHLLDSRDELTERLSNNDPALAEFFTQQR